MRVRLPVVLGALGAALGGLAVVAFLVFVFGMRHYRVPSSAMEPTLHCARRGLGCEAGSSDRILIPRLGWFQHVDRGDIVVFRAPPLARQRCGAGDTLLKRIIGLPGETVHEDAQGFVEIDGRKLAEPYVEAERRGADVSNRNRTWHVRHGEYFTMGDNRGSSCDSRVWGGVPRENVIGEVIAIYWPPRRIGRP